MLNICISRFICIPKDLRNLSHSKININVQWISTEVTAREKSLVRCYQDHVCGDFKNIKAKIFFQVWDWIKAPSHLPNLVFVLQSNYFQVNWKYFVIQIEFLKDRLFSSQFKSMNQLSSSTIASVDPQTILHHLMNEVKPGLPLVSLQCYQLLSLSCFSFSALFQVYTRFSCTVLFFLTIFFILFSETDL